MSESLEQVRDQTRMGLTPEQQENLSKVLFPSTHTDEVMLCGKKRKVRPLTIRPAKELYSLVAPVWKKSQKALEEDSEDDLDIQLADALLEATKFLCEHYGWKDVLKKLETEDVQMDEVQDFIRAQTEIQSSSDFLLSPLRHCLMVMQMAELNNAQYRSLVIMPLSATPGK